MCTQNPSCLTSFYFIPPILEASPCCMFLKLDVLLTVCHLRVVEQCSYMALMVSPIQPFHFTNPLSSWFPLLDHARTTYVRDHGQGNMTPLHTAASYGHDTVVSTLITAGANVHAVAKVCLYKGRKGRGSTICTMMCSIVQA